MKMYDVHSHLGKTSSGEENSAALLVEDLARYGITKVGISSLSGTVTRVQNDLVHSAMQQFPGVVMGYLRRGCPCSLERSRRPHRARQGPQWGRSALRRSQRPLRPAPA